MSLPSFTQYGTILVRKNPATGDEVFIGWIIGDTCWHFDAPGPGSWEYRVYLVAPSDTALVSIAYGDGIGGAAPAELAVQAFHR